MASTQVAAPSTPTAPSTSSSIADWVQNYPSVFALQQQYAPQEAAQQVSLAQQYALPYGQAMQAAQEGMYPGTTAIQENLANQSIEGMSSQMPDWAKQQYQSGVNAQLGSNVNSPIGADYASRGMMQQQEDWKRYYQNLGLSVTGRQPLTQASTPQTSNYTQAYTPGSVMSYNSGNYGNYVGAYSSMYGANAGLQGSANTVNQGYAQMGASAAGSLLGSSQRYKTNIKLWA